MAGLPENKTYSKENVASIVGAMKGINQSIRKRYQPEGVDVSQYKGLADKVKSSAPVSAPSSIKNLGRISTPYGGRTNYESVHNALDIANKIGTPIPAFAGGIVTESVTGKKHGEAGFGNYVKIIDDQNREWRYSHLENNYIPVGGRVTAGQHIGSMGASGSTYSSRNKYDPNNPDTWGSHLDLRVFDCVAGFC